MLNRLSTFQYIALGLLLCPMLAQASERVGSAEDAVLRGLRGAMRAVTKPVEIATSRSEDLYRFNGGTDLGAAVNLLTGSSANDYITALSVCTKYWVKLTFQSSRADSGEISGTDEIPVPKGVLGKVIYLVPVAESTDFQVTAWECITNFTLANPLFKGDTKVGTEMDPEGTTSTRAVLAKYTDHPVLEKCVYLDSSDWTTATDTEPGTC